MYLIKKILLKSEKWRPEFLMIMYVIYMMESLSTVVLNSRKMVSNIHPPP